MTTEQDIIYTMLETLKGAELNNDEPIGERLLRQHLRKHRPDIMRKHYRNGLNVDPEVFQTLKITLTPVKANPTNSEKTDVGFSKVEYYGKVPKIIRFINNTGYFIEKDGFGISVTNPSEYRAERRNFNTKFKPLAKALGDLIYLYIGDKDSKHIEENSDMWNLINSLESSLNQNAKSLVIDFNAVLLNPSDDPNYNWKEDIYPFPADRINELCNQIYSKEFSVIVQAKPDEVQNARPDNVIYHQNDDVNNN